MTFTSNKLLSILVVFASISIVAIAIFASSQSSVTTLQSPSPSPSPVVRKPVVRPSVFATVTTPVGANDDPCQQYCTQCVSDLASDKQLLLQLQKDLVTAQQQAALVDGLQKQNVMLSAQLANSSAQINTLTTTISNMQNQLTDANTRAKTAEDTKSSAIAEATALANKQLTAMLTASAPLLNQLRAKVTSFFAGCIDFDHCASDGIANVIYIVDKLNPCREDCKSPSQGFRVDMFGVAGKGLFTGDFFQGNGHSGMESWMGDHEKGFTTIIDSLSTAFIPPSAQS